MSSLEHGPVLVGVTGDQPSIVAEQGVRFAEAFDASIVFAWVDTTQFTTGFMSDGTVAFSSFEGDAEAGAVPDASWLDERAREAVGDRSLAWTTKVGSGQPAAVLAAFADEVQARMIVVGTREPGFMAGLQEFLGGSVAAHLAHTQSRPVVVVPLTPVKKGDSLPWDAEG